MKMQGEIDTGKYSKILLTGHKRKTYQSIYFQFLKEKKTPERNKHNVNMINIYIKVKISIMLKNILNEPNSGKDIH